MRKLTQVIDIFVILIVVVVSWVYTYVKTYQTMYFKYMPFIVCQLYFKKLLKNKAKRTLDFCMYEINLGSL